MATIHLKVDNINKLNKNIFGIDGFQVSSKKEILIAEINPILLNKSLKYPEKVYTHFSGNVDDNEHLSINGISVDLFHIPQNLLGVECSRTHVYTSENFSCKCVTIIEIVEGEIAVILQKNEYEDEFAPLQAVAELKVIKLKSGEKLTVPSGYMYSFVNVGERDAYFFIMSKGLEIIDYHRIQKEKGLAVFVISKNSKVEVAANPKYKIESYPQLESIEDLEEDEYNNFCSASFDDLSLFSMLKQNVSFLQECFAD